MNNRVLMWIAMLVWLAFTYFFVFQNAQQKPQDLPKPAVLLQQAQKLEAAAGDDQEKLDKAVKAYNRLIGIKQYAKTEQVAEAQLRVGIMQETKLLKRSNKVSRWLGSPEYGTGFQEQNAVQTYRNIIKKHPPEESAVGEQAEARLASLKTKIDKQNSSHILYKVMDRSVKATGANPKFSYALALLVITVIFKVLTTPLSHLQFKYMREMQRIQPLVKQLQEKYKDNQKEFGPKLMDLYKEHGVNPFGSCLPVLVQLPVLYLLYWMVRLYEFQFTNGKFLWIGSGLADKWPTIIGDSLARADIPLLVLYTISMFISQKLTVVDPTQAEQQKIMTYTMPLMFGVMFWWWAFPSAFMLYWLFFNIVSTTQQYFILRKPAEAVATAGGKASAVLPAAAEKGNGPKRAATSPGKKKRSKRR